MSDIFVSDVLNYKEHIEPYRLIKIFAGVGSGKNTFIESFIKGDKEPEIPQKTVLLITSRRAKVDETISKMDIETKEALKKWEKIHRVISYDNEKYENNNQYKIIPSIDKKTKYVVEQKSVACTNAFIEYYFKNIYSPSDTSTHLWELFDMIVVDEAHSLVTDATYQSSPFYTFELINHYLTLCNSINPPTNCKHLILMTGTPKPIEKIDLVEISKELTVVHNLLDVCRNVAPKTIAFTDKNNIKFIIQSIIKTNNRLIYFSNHILMPNKIREYFLVGDSKFAVSFSDKKRRKELGKDDKKIMEDTEEYLKNTGYLPDDIQLFFTTSRNKEGINIENEDIQYMIIETHNQTDIVQMAGRVRKGIKCVFIVTNSEGYDDKEYEKLALFTKSKIADYNLNYVGVANEFYRQLCIDNDFDDLYSNSKSDITLHKQKKKASNDLTGFINYIHLTFPYVKYSYIYNAFMFYKLKEIGKADSDYYEETFSENPDSWKEIFPHTEIKSTISNRTMANKCIKKYLGDKTDKILTKEESQRLKQELIKVLGLPENSSLLPMINNNTDYFCKAEGKKGKYKISINEQ